MLLLFLYRAFRHPPNWELRRISEDPSDSPAWKKENLRYKEENLCFKQILIDRSPAPTSFQAGWAKDFFQHLFVFACLVEINAAGKNVYLHKTFIVGYKRREATVVYHSSGL